MLLVDVREPNEIEVEAFPDAVVVPLSQFDPAAIPDPQGKQVVFACRSGNRSVTASLAAQAAGLAVQRAPGRRHQAVERAWSEDRDLTAARRVAPTLSIPGREPMPPLPIRRTLVAVAAAGRSRLAPAFAQPKKERIVNVYNWSDYIDPAVLEDFTKETGIKVRYDTFDSNDTLETKLLAGKVRLRRGGADRLFPRAPDQGRRVPEARQGEAAQPRQSSGRRSPSGSPPTIPATSTPSTTCGARPASATTSRRCAKSSVPSGKIDSWDIVFKPESLAKFKDCGVHMLDSADDILPAALHYLGLDPNSTKEADLQKAADLVTKIRPSVRKFHSSEYLNALATGEICLVVGLSGDIKQAQKRAAEAKNGVEIGYAIPKEGAQLWFDNLAIPKDARNVDEAHAFINYLLRPEVAAKNSNFISYANGNLASQKFIDKAILDDKTIYPDEATMARLYTINAHDAKTQRLMNRLWTRIKTGR